MTTSIFAAKDALAALFAATFAADADPVTVLNGPRGSLPSIADRAVMLGKVTGRSEPDAMDRSTWAEVYDVEVVISVSLQGTSQAAARAALLDLWQRAEVAVREHPTGDLGASASGVLGAWPGQSFELQENAAGDGRQAAVVWGVLVRAQRQ